MYRVLRNHAGWARAALPRHAAPGGTADTCLCMPPDEPGADE